MNFKLLILLILKHIYLKWVLLHPHTNFVTTNTNSCKHLSMIINIHKHLKYLNNKIDMTLAYNLCLFLCAVAFQCTWISSWTHLSHHSIMHAPPHMHSIQDITHTPTRNYLSWAYTSTAIEQQSRNSTPC